MRLTAIVFLFRLSRSNSSYCFRAGRTSFQPECPHIATVAHQARGPLHGGGKRLQCCHGSAAEKGSRRSEPHGCPAQPEHTAPKLQHHDGCHRQVRDERYRAWKIPDDGHAKRVRIDDVRRTRTKPSRHNPHARAGSKDERRQFPAHASRRGGGTNCR